jgi:hypothetical protein
MKNSLNLNAYGVEELSQEIEIFGGSNNPVPPTFIKRVPDITGGCAMIVLVESTPTGTNFYTALGTPLSCVNGQWTGAGYHGCK